MAHQTPFPLSRQTSHSLFWALLFSFALHGAVLGFLPGFSFDSSKLPDSPLTVELLHPEPPPPPPPEPEKPKPEPVKPKPIKAAPVKIQPVPQPLIQPPAQPVAKTEPPPSPVAEPPKVEAPPAVIAVEQKASEPAPPVVIPVATPTPRETDGDAIANARNNYRKLLSTEFARNKKYPQVALMRGWQGTVLIQLQIDAEGNASNPVVIQSSGKELLDNSALESVKKKLPLPLPPDILRGKPFPITVPYTYRIENP